MKVTPVRRYPQPRYPTYAILEEHPEILRLVPRRWRNNRVVLAALAGVCTILLGCQRTPRAGGTNGGSGAGKSPAVSLVAPILVHGDGRGAFGCDAVNPPVFLSEEEARQVVVQEAKKAGIVFAETDTTLEGISVPVTDRYGFGPRSGEGRSYARLVERGDPLTLDGTAPELGVSYEYVSSSDFEAWERTHRSPVDSVYSYDTRETATVLRTSLAAARPDGAYVVFYDPMVRPEAWWRKPRPSGSPAPTASDSAKAHVRRAATAVDTAKEELRKQVRDFITWLKAQGVI
ncbi:MAG: hypothetical protein COZ06_20690 [Armatimonadetes bacterium CG_4_10_14_3_um_filter_66_18]|nr:hypothetical protein [Armatimonadota bacterium]OIP11406.1 MAG: hypothetical protein AUJ96_02340 [Armatimonadetes bacterium CG2_30_66_41]PIU93937.1 MAG: hypothetical protein COS65_10150 [Armatimonadetes bacterium CG06_land_8_20_14_3_00_66_21]PIX48425.1 MAG: hypothetical protein COZ57_05525 [Armatimonadetes bacterium CG_4_8_14_3_um_filter_66_20]PIY44406.1 MAG: hypothetical protein COZ06_20690 [Armatimonadetes bacterium CG_4_10_14_3_um_filter_66_18]PIZ40826.1 MAG: hypothetical protein COY42_20